MTAFRRFLMGWLVALAVAPPAAACNVPVFRYALERWRPDPYEVIVFHRGPLSTEHRSLVDRLEKAADGEPVPANVLPFLVDLDKEKDKGLLALFAAQPKAILPWAVVRYPEGSRVQETLFAGGFDDALVQALLDSPARREVAKRILNGETAVWVLLESGDRDKDNAAAALLEAEAKELPKLLKLPVLTDDPADKITQPGDLRIAFSHVRLARTDAKEKFLVEMLLHTEKDLPALSEPMVFTVFGRGRTLFALVGKGISKDNVEQDAVFLVGPCSCEVKRASPGVDLLVSADWDGQLQKRQVKDPVLPELTGLTGFLDPRTLPIEQLAVVPREIVPTVPEEAVQPAITKPAPEDPAAMAEEAHEAGAPAPIFLYYVLAGVAGGLVVLLVVTLLAFRRE